MPTDALQTQRSLPGQCAGCSSGRVVRHAGEGRTSMTSASGAASQGVSSGGPSTVGRDGCARKRSLNSPSS
ncbi:MAG TPA: hypothetical protein VFX59_17520 [Polyangiales bacterium]|nr:hypothetical protein [Polyangiales bacterium]